MRIIFIVLLLMPGLYAGAQKSHSPGRFLPRATASGEGRIDSRADNMGYWRNMAKSGYVEVEPYRSCTPARFTGSEIDNRAALTTNSADVAVTTESSTQSENSVFVDPSDSLFILNSNNSTNQPYTNLYGANYFISSDAGSTWGGSVYGAGEENAGDPTTAIGLDGSMYVGFIDDQYYQTVSYSTDGGSTWTPVVAGQLINSANLLDKNHLWIDNSPTSPYEGYVYDAWTCFGGTNDGEIEFVRSTNGGVSWSSQTVISAAISAGSHNQGVNIQTGPDGEVYALWSVYDTWPADESALGMAKSTDGGATFSPASRILGNIKGIRVSATSKNQRVNSFPSMAVDISDGPHSGTVYIVWTNQGVPGINTGSDIDIYLIKSGDEGATWSTPIRVNQDTAGLGHEHYFPWITCDPYTGDLAVIFYDDRNVGGADCETFVAVSFDAGESWEDFKVSDVSFTPAGIGGMVSGYMGDYLGISSSRSMVYPVWTDNRTGVTMSYVSPFELSRIPSADFEASDTRPCLGETVTLSDLSTKNPTSWLWTISSPGQYTYVDGTNNASQNPHVQFTAYGNYSVTLVTENNYGADTLTLTDFISVNQTNSDFNANNTSPFVGDTVIFSDASSCSITSYLWDFGTDASPATATTAGPHEVVYSSTGYKTVSLTLNGNVTTTKSNFIDVRPEVYYMSNSTVTTCSGIFYDHEGTSPYQNGEYYVMTFYPEDTSASIQSTFTYFDLEYVSTCGFDHLTIYDGPSTSSPVIGTYCGTASPGTVTATRSTGALTFEFTSDNSNVYNGWIASLACVAPPPSQYCLAAVAECEEYISHVQYGDIDNLSSCATGGYYDYTALSNLVARGTGQGITVTNGYPDAEDYCKAWIDWNQDSDFDDADEAVAFTGSPGTGPYTATITAPSGAEAGFTRMRVRIRYSLAPEACGTTEFGEVEDYAVYVGTRGLWKGGAAGNETSWSEAANWDDRVVPSSSDDVLIPASALYQPQMTGTVQCNDLTIEDDAVLYLYPGTVFTVTGSLDIGDSSDGSLVVDGAVCTVQGAFNANPGSLVRVKSGGTLNINN